MKQLKDGKTELHIVNDKFGTPTYTLDFSENVEALLQTEYWGLYNMVSEGITCRLEVAKELISILGLQNKIIVTEVTSDYFKNEYFAARPESERLLNKKLILRRLNRMRDWKIALKE